MIENKPGRTCALILASSEEIKHSLPRLLFHVVASRAAINQVTTLKLTFYKEITWKSKGTSFNLYYIDKFFSYSPALPDQKTEIDATPFRLSKRTSY